MASVPFMWGLVMELNPLTYTKKKKTFTTEDNGILFFEKVCPLKKKYDSWGKENLNPESSHKGDQSMSIELQGSWHLSFQK